MGGDGRRISLRRLKKHGDQVTGPIAKRAEDVSGGSAHVLSVQKQADARFGSAAESVDRRKQSKLIACAQHFMLTHPDTCEQPCRFDVISMTGSSTAIEWIPNAFTAAE